MFGCLCCEFDVSFVNVVYFSFSFCWVQLFTRSNGSPSLKSLTLMAGKLMRSTERRSFVKNFCPNEDDFSRCLPLLLLQRLFDSKTRHKTKSKADESIPDKKVLKKNRKNIKRKNKKKQKKRYQRHGFFSLVFRFTTGIRWIVELTVVLLFIWIVVICIKHFAFSRCAYLFVGSWNFHRRRRCCCYSAFFYCI